LQKIARLQKRKSKILFSVVEEVDFAENSWLQKLQKIARLHNQWFTIKIDCFLCEENEQRGDCRNSLAAMNFRSRAGASGFGWRPCPPPLLKFSSYRVSYSCRSRHRKKTKKERRLKNNQPGGGTPPARPRAALGGAPSSWGGMEMEARGRSGRSQPPLLGDAGWATGEAPVRRSWSWWCSPRRASDGVTVGIRSRKKEDSDGWSRPGLRWWGSRGKDSGLWADTRLFLR
jgi:hypothetical protein